jgi:hypothetical protein
MISVAILSVLAVNCKAQESTKEPKPAKRVIENFEIQHSVSLFVSQSETNLVSFGTDLSGHLRLLGGALRAGVEFGIGKCRFDYAGDGSYRYTAELNASAFTTSLLIGTDLLPKRKFDLVLSFGAGLLVPYSGTFWQYSYEYSSTHPVRYKVVPSKKPYPTVTGEFSLRFPIGKGAKLFLSYTFNRIFTQIESETRLIEEWPEHMGQQHELKVGFCQYIGFGQRKRKSHVTGDPSER